ncbi:hypothetical protein ASPSYDRAFT_90924 [Aspergillus sydowii CBS 593.65]|uniref:Inhibitor I9 domain-containing protein n=1 Tax=Aspergillus sydowii CBS 593.65 TaxID=1036612 RepID=A0A1L9TEB0_9EURO|nr:uncharacterized protein ASPSYDRAFT_90924 [Aspergillus sydowii CBS 593.65]OJJ57643.1 hypothetical protein ASPSYDRAFT_90924 [Aspergillus sydowii CBS 593.65]
MPKYIVSFKRDSPEDTVQQVKDQIRESGGNITHEYTLIRAIAVDLPEVSAMSAQVLGGHPHVERVEEDGVLKTQ